jgi:hypothetical protein
MELLSSFVWAQGMWKRLLLFFNMSKDMGDSGLRDLVQEDILPCGIGFKC